MSYDNTTGAGYDNTYTDNNTQPRHGIIGKIQDKLEQRRERKEYERETGQGGTGLLSGLTGNKGQGRVEGTGTGYGGMGSDYTTTSSEVGGTGLGANTGYGATDAGYNNTTGYNTAGIGNTGGIGSTGYNNDGLGTGLGAGMGTGIGGVGTGGIAEPVVRARVVESHVEGTGNLGTGIGGNTYTEGAYGDNYGANTMSTTGTGFNQGGEDVYGGNVNPNTGKSGIGQRLKDAARDVGNDLKGRPHTNLDNAQRTNY